MDNGQNLPTHGFKWKDAENLTPEKIDKLVKKDKRGYLLEVDGVSKRAGRKSQCAAIINGENENW